MQGWGLFTIGSRPEAAKKEGMIEARTKWLLDLPSQRGAWRSWPGNLHAGLIEQGPFLNDS